MDEKRDDGYEVMISVEPPADMRSGMSAVEIVMNGTLIFNGRTATVTEFLSAALPYLDQIAGTLDNIRAMRMIEGREFTRLELERKDGA